jgi:hypothetical protein
MGKERRPGRMTHQGGTTSGKATKSREQSHAGKGNTLAKLYRSEAPPAEQRGNAIMTAVAYRDGREVERWQGQANWEWEDLPVEFTGERMGGRWTWSHEQGKALCVASQSSETCGIEIEAWARQHRATKVLIVLGAHPDSQEAKHGEGDALDRSLAEMYSDLIPAEPQSAHTSTQSARRASPPSMADMFGALLGDEVAAAGFGEQGEGLARGQGGERGQDHGKGKRDGASNGSATPSWYTLPGAAVNNAQGGRTPEEHSTDWGSAGGQRGGKGNMLGSGLWAGIIDFSAEVAAAINVAIIISDAHFTGFSERVLGKVVRGMSRKELGKELAEDAERLIATRLRKAKETLDGLPERHGISQAQIDAIMRQAREDVVHAYYTKARQYFARQADDTERLLARYADKPGDQAAHLRELAGGNAQAYRKMERAAMDKGGLEAADASADIARTAHGGARNTTASPALSDSPYHPDAVSSRVRPPYRSNPAHDPRNSRFNPRKTPEPEDAASVYETAVRGDMKTWYGVGKHGVVYRYFSDNVGGAHFSGSISLDEVPKAVRQRLEL